MKNFVGALGAVLVVLVLGSCATLETFNPDGVPEEQLVELKLAKTSEQDIESAFAIAAINGIPVIEEIGSVLIESVEHGEVNTVRLPAGTHVFTIRLRKPEGLGRRPRYMDQRIDMEFTLEHPGARYVLTRENSFFNAGETTIVLRSPGPMPFMETLFSRKLEEVPLRIVGYDEFEIVN